MSREDFRILQSGNMAYFDHAASSLTPDVVLSDMDQYYHEYRSNIHRGVYPWSAKASFIYEEARVQVAKFIGAKPHELVFTQGTTAGINLIPHIFLKRRLQKDQLILLSPLEHHSNLLPWQKLAQETGARVHYLKLHSDFSIDFEDLEKWIPKAGFIALTHSSNVLGVELDVKRIASYGVPTLVDGAQKISHGAVDVKDLGCAFYVFSGHKMYGPTGIGGLYIDERYHDDMEPHILGGGMVDGVSYEKASFQKMPTLLEPGTPNIAGAIGLASAVRYLESKGWDRIQMHEKKIMQAIQSELSHVNLKTYGPLDTTVYSFEYPGVHPHDVATLLADEKVMVRAGHHCCMPLMGYLGVNALTRISIGLHNHLSDIDTLVTAFDAVKAVML